MVVRCSTLRNTPMQLVNGPCSAQCSWMDCTRDGDTGTALTRLDLVLAKVITPPPILAGVKA